MDTNRNNGQNYQINAFNKGMNTDTALDAVDEGQYIFGLNIRIANNTLLLGDIDPNSKEGLITPVGSGILRTSIHVENPYKILGAASINNIGVIIVKNSGGFWDVYRIERDESTGELTSRLLYNSKSETTRDKFSLVINKELEDIIKLYIADGDHGMMQLFVKNGEDPNDLTDLNITESEDDLISGKYFPIDKAVITGTTSGNLKTQQVQYTYRFYKRFGIFSKLAPLTNKILIINANRDTELGNAEDTITTIGVKLRIPVTTEISQLFDHVQLLRVSYVVAGQVPEIELVKDTKLQGSADLNIIDTGEDPLEELSVDDFAALNTQTLIPKVIEQNQGYMFAANVKDDTVFYVDPVNITKFDLSFVIGNLVVDANESIKNDDNIIYKYQYNVRPHGAIQLNSVREYLLQMIEIIDDGGGNNGGSDVTPLQPSENTDVVQGITEEGGTSENAGLTTIEYDETHEEIMRIRNYFSTCGIELDSDYAYGGYEDMFVSSMCRSLRRGESYLYGLVLYKKDGTHSDVLLPTQINVPSEDLLPAWEYHNQILYALPVGIIAEVEITNMPDVVGYEIVRCQKTPNSSKILLTSVLSRPVSERLVGNDDNKYTPAYPQSFLNTSTTRLRSISSSDSIRHWSFIPYDTYSDDLDTYYMLFHYLSGDLLNEYLNYFIRNSVEWPPTSETDPWRLLVWFMYNVELNTANGIAKVNEIVSAVNYNIQQEYIQEREKVLRSAYTQHTLNLLLVFAPEILYRRKDILEILANSLTQMVPIYNLGMSEYPAEFHSTTNNPINIISPRITPSLYKDKPTTHMMFYYVEQITLSNPPTPLDIKRVKDVKNPLWDSGFTQIDTNSSDSRIINGVKQYKTYNTSIGQYEYVNWVCNCMYDLPISAEEAKNDVRFNDTDLNDSAKAGYRVYNDAVHYDFKTQYNSQSSTSHYGKNEDVMVAIGPGPVCLLAEVLENGETLSYSKEIIENGTTKYLPTAVVVNIINKSFSGYTEDQKLYMPYCGFGNFGKLTNGSGSIVVFDGDAYSTMCEFVTMFKTYDFKSLNDTLISNQYVCRVPMETSINTYFDYGMNYRNTQNKNLQLEPGTITNVTTQDRPLNQYNSIYSDNNTSVSIYTAQQLDLHTNKFPQRICYSQHKNNGEQIESWNIFKPVDYIDADTRYGEITNLLSANDTIFFWQDRAFGKLSVNERSLVTDNNNNTIQLGQGGVLQRTDYLSTKYGMRPEDYSAVNTEQGLFWIDILNKAIVANTQNGVVNYGEQLNVQNLINKNISEDKPEIDYDLQNSELLCKCFSRGDLLIFNIKYNIATSIYSRNYYKLLYFNNVIYALNKLNAYSNDFEVKQINYCNNVLQDLLFPTVLQFVVNSNPSQTKVFDNQKIVVAKKLDNTYSQDIEFKTDANVNSANMTLIVQDEHRFDDIVDREGNICYAVPRENTENKYPQLRMRGKWMTVKITDEHPKNDFAISHIITKFRQSYS